MEKSCSAQDACVAFIATMNRRQRLMLYVQRRNLLVIMFKIQSDDWRQRNQGKFIQFAGNPLQRSGAVPPLILDVTTDTAVVPVELRSPRGEGGAFPRPNMREKRNARVFALPSSDDSETDNLLARLNKHVEQQKWVFRRHVAMETNRWFIVAVWLVGWVSSSLFLGLFQKVYAN